MAIVCIQTPEILVYHHLPAESTMTLLMLLFTKGNKTHNQNYTG